MSTSEAPLPKLHVILASTRDGREGRGVAEWFLGRARAHGGFEVTLVDLRDVALPLFDEPHHPRFRKYQHDHTKRWSATITAADAFVFVLPEYNHGAPPAFVNAVDYLSTEWGYKAAAIVSYGGVSAGTRSAEMAKQILTTLKVMVIPEAVSIPFFMKLKNDAGVFDASPGQDAPAKAMLDELARWTKALATLRA